MIPVKLAMIVTKTISGTTETGLDGNITTFLQTIKEEQLLEIRFAGQPGLFVAFLVYTR